ncbi:MAG TPA: hypothetical protein VI479_16915 [Blastocatellia bacterium]
METLSAAANWACEFAGDCAIATAPDGRTRANASAPPRRRALLSPPPMGGKTDFFFSDSPVEEIECPT